MGNERTGAVWGYGAGASGFGTYNQSGNVWEWCSDWWEEGYYGKSPAENPTGPSGGSFRVIRGGGCWYGVVSDFRGAYRFWSAPSLRNVRQGFRLVKTAA